MAHDLRPGLASLNDELPEVRTAFAGLQAADCALHLMEDINKQPHNGGRHAV